MNRLSKIQNLDESQYLFLFSSQLHRAIPDQTAFFLPIDDQNILKFCKNRAGRLKK